MRIFIGFKLPILVKEYLTTQQVLIKQAAKIGRYTEYDNFHLTLKFIGECSSADVDLIREILFEVASHHQGFSLKIGGLGSFIRQNKHIVFTEIIEGIKPLKALYKDVEARLYEEGLIERLETYKPHITLAREVVFHEVSVLDIVNNYPDEIMVNEVTIFHSKRDKQGKLIYEDIENIPLVCK